MVYAQLMICPGKWDAQSSLRFLDTNRSPNLGQKIRLSASQKEKKMKTCRIEDFAVPADYRVKLKESETRDKYLDLARGLKKKQ